MTFTRANIRNTVERRTNDRRLAGYVFGLDEWIAHVKKNYVAWPKFDRRQSTRRTSERRQNVSDKNARAHNSSYNPRVDYSSDLLTKDERLFFDHLFKNKKS